ncbi:hypothetical protein KXX11_003804, partial [Aspergillus fumigatus]
AFEDLDRAFAIALRGAGLVGVDPGRRSFGGSPLGGGVVGVGLRLVFFGHDRVSQSLDGPNPR